jgi:DNA-binding beta-propeller fold protein YncE
MRAVAAALAALALAVSAACAQIAVSANDGKLILSDGSQVVPAHPEPDTATIIDLGRTPPRVLGEVKVPTSVIGPPESVAISPDQSFALITAATKIDPANPSAILPDNKVSVIDLKSLKVIQTLEAGLGASGVSINRAGTLALVANRAEGAVSIFTIAGRTLTPAGKLALDPKSGPSHVVFTPDGVKALLTRDGDSKISVLAIDGANVTNTGNDIYAGISPYGIEVSTKGDVAIVANIGKGGNDDDTVSIIDLNATPIHVVNTVTVGPTPEGIALSVDGKYLAVSIINGSNKTKGAPGFHDHGMVKVFRRRGFGLSFVAGAKTGHWCEGAAWSRNHRTLLVQCMVEKRIFVYSFDGKSLKCVGAIAVKGGPAGMRAAE